MKAYGPKLKLLYLKDFFEKKTDENHGVTIKDMQKYLQECGIDAERKALYEDVDALQSFGMDIDHEEYQKSYRLLSRDFETYELKLMIDAISSSRFLSEARSRTLINKLKGLCSEYEAQTLQRQVMLANRVKNTGRNMHINVDQICQAVAANKQIQFRYFDYNLKKEKELYKRVYVMSPWTLLYADDNYYLLAYDAAEKKGDKKLKYFRVDKMEQVELLEDDRLGAEEYAQIDMKTRTKSTFNMFGGEIVNVTLRFPNFRIGLVLDRFGHEITPRKDGDSHFTITVPVAVGPQFYGWVFGLKNYVTIVGPEHVRKGMQDMLEAVGKRYENVNER